MSKARIETYGSTIDLLGVDTDGALKKASRSVVANGVFSTIGSLTTGTPTYTVGVDSGGSPVKSAGPVLWEWNGTDTSQFDAVIETEAGLGGGSAATLSVVTDTDALPFGKVLRWNGNGRTSGGGSASRYSACVFAAGLVTAERYAFEVGIRARSGGSGGQLHGAAWLGGNDGTHVIGLGWSSATSARLLQRQVPYAPLSNGFDLLGGADTTPNIPLLMRAETLYAGTNPPKYVCTITFAPRSASGSCEAIGLRHDQAFVNLTAPTDAYERTQFGLVMYGDNSAVMGSMDFESLRVLSLD
jgi:hypothetical protein